MTQQLDDLKPKEFWIAPEIQKPISDFIPMYRKAYDDKGDNGQEIHVIEYQAYEQLQRKFEEAVEVIKIIDINFNKITKCPDNTCDGCHEDAKIAAEYSGKFLSSLDKEK